VTGVYLSIITQALTFALMLGFFRNNFGFRRQQRPSPTSRTCSASTFRQAGNPRRPVRHHPASRWAGGARHVPRHRRVQIR